MQIYCICGAWETRTPHLDTAFYSINKAVSAPRWLYCRSQKSIGFFTL